MREYIDYSPTCKLFSCNLWIYFPIISNSIFTGSPILEFQRFVQSCVRGISDTVMLHDSRETIVRLTPFIVILHFLITRLSYWFG